MARGNAIADYLNCDMIAFWDDPAEEVPMVHGRMIAPALHEGRRVPWLRYDPEHLTQGRKLGFRGERGDECFADCAMQRVFLRRRIAHALRNGIKRPRKKG